MVIVGLLIGIIAFIIPLTIIALIISAVVKKNKDSKGSFEESVRNIYTYIILIITLISIIMGTIATFRIGLDILLPEESVYQHSYNSDLVDKNEQIIELFTTLSLVISVLPIYIYHNKLAKNNKSSVIETENINENQKDN